MSGRRKAPTRANRYAGPCRFCGEMVDAGEGLAVRDTYRWTVRHRPPRFVGSPVSGRWADGCPLSDRQDDEQLARRDPGYRPDSLAHASVMVLPDR